VGLEFVSCSRQVLVDCVLSSVMQKKAVIQVCSQKALSYKRLMEEREREREGGEKEREREQQSVVTIEANRTERERERK
jgi:hypothetical protein